MAIEKVINIKVQETGVDELNKDLKKLDKNLDNVKSESKKTSTGLKEVGDNGVAIAVLDSLTGGLATRLRDSAEASKLFNFSLKGTRTALIATGIGAFVVALGLVVAYWEDIKNFITGANLELERKLGMLQKLGDEQQRELDLLDKQDNILKLQGKSQKQINDLKKKELEDIIEIRSQELELSKQRLSGIEELRKAGGNSLEQIARISQAVFVGLGQAVDKIAKFLGLDTQFTSASAVFSESVIEGIFGSKEDLDEANQKVDDLESNILDARNRLAGIILEENDSGSERSKVKPVGSGLTSEEQDAELLKVSTQFEELFGLKKIQQDALIGLGKEGLDQINNDKNIANAVQTENDRIWAERRKEIARLEGEAKEKILLSQVDNVANGFALLGKLAGKNEALQKAALIGESLAGIAKVVINTQAANAAATLKYALLPGGIALAAAERVANNIGAGVSIASNVTATAAALKQLGGGSVAGGSNSLGGGGGGASAPSFNVVGNSGVSQIGQTLNQDQEPVQAFVVGNAVTSQQALDRDIVETATLG